MTDRDPDRAVGNTNGHPRGAHTDIVLSNRYAAAAHADTAFTNRYAAAAHLDANSAD